MHRMLFYIALLASVGIGQQLVVKTPQGTTNVPTQTSVQATYNNSTQSIDNHERSPKITIIVELTAPSLLQQRKNKFSGAASFPVQHSQLQQQISKAVPDAEITKNFSILFNAVAVSAAERDIETIRTIPGVKKVYEDMVVTSTPVPVDVSAVQTGTVATTATGNGIKIGIIDTGIDYMHEAFGKGYGSTFTVAGGYDFVNNDSDPMDDNGHGTHVAGIIAGSSDEIRGAARQATLYAYKSLNAQGNGKASDVIAALERALADSVDILNISLGSVSGNPNDVLCEAVNRVVEEGIVVVAAAGNAGEYESIHSPGLAHNALTVGATDGNAVASFSSKGPVSASYDIKPDVVAPGVGIKSAKAGGGYVAMSGTSMAAPYVTAIAAIVKQLHPDWSPRQIKNAIVSHATDLRHPLFAQGKGKVEIGAILQSNVITQPSYVNFGFDDPALSHWISSDTVAISNTTTGGKRYTFTAQSANPAISVSITPSIIDIPAHESKTIVVMLNANNSFLADNKNFSAGYTGIINGYGDDTLAIPFTFFKGNILQVEYSAVPWQVLLHNGSTFATTIVPKGNFTSFVLNKGTYDIVTSFFGSSYVIKEGVTVSGRTNVVIDKNEAVNEITLAPVDEQGASFGAAGTFSYIEGIVHKSSGHAYVGMGGGMMNTFRTPKKYISNTSNRYTFAFALNVQRGTSRSYTFDVALDSGISTSRQFTFQGSDLRKVELKYSPNTPSEKIFPLAWSSFVGAQNYISVTFYDGNDAPLTFPYIQTAFYSNRIASSPIYHFREAYRY